MGNIASAYNFKREVKQPKSREFKDAKMPQDYLEVTVREYTMGDLVLIEGRTDDYSGMVELDRDTVRAMGNYLIELSNELGGYNDS